MNSFELEFLANNNEKRLLAEAEKKDLYEPLIQRTVL